MKPNSQDPEISRSNEDLPRNNNTNMQADKCLSILNLGDSRERILSEENIGLKQKIEILEKEMSALREKMIQYVTNKQQQQTAAIAAAVAVNQQSRPVTTTNDNDESSPTQMQCDIMNFTQSQTEVNVSMNSNDDEKEEDNTPFEIVKKNVKNKNKKPTVQQQRSTTQKQQQQMQATRIPKQGTSTQTTSNINITASANTTTAANKNTVVKKNIRPPPIHIHTQQINDTIALMKGTNIKNFNIKRVNTNKHTLQVDTLDNYKAAKETLNDVNTQYFTYTIKEEKPKTIVLKGLHENENMDELKTLLKEHDIEVINITQLRTKNSTAKDKKLPLYIVICAPETNMGKLYAIKTLNYQKATWESLKKHDTIMQCHQCQRFGHAAVNCKLQYRCVKCDKSHDPGQCTIKDKVNKEKVYCTNCQANGHPASYRGCPIYQATLERLRQKINEKRTQKQTAANIPITKHTYVNMESGTFADMLKEGKQQQHLQQQQLPTQLLEQTNIIQQLTTRIDKVATAVAQQGEQISTLLALIQQLKG